MLNLQSWQDSIKPAAFCKNDYYADKDFYSDKLLWKFNKIEMVKPGICVNFGPKK